MADRPAKRRMSAELVSLLKEHNLDGFHTVFQNKGYVELRMLQNLSSRLRERLEDALLDAGAPDADVNVFFNSLQDYAYDRRDAAECPPPKRQRLSEEDSFSVSLSSSSSLSLSPQSHPSSLSLNCDSTASSSVNPHPASSSTTSFTSLSRFAFRGRSSPSVHQPSLPPASDSSPSSSSSSDSSSTSNSNIPSSHSLPSSHMPSQSATSLSSNDAAPHQAQPIVADSADNELAADAADSVRIRKQERKAVIEEIFRVIRRIRPDISDDINRFLVIRDRTPTDGF